jgi:glutamate 5-kinase
VRTRKRPADSQSHNAAGGLRYRRIVAKLGTNLLTGGGDRLDLQVMAALVGQVAGVRSHGGQVIVVSSGAVAAGRHRLGPERGGHVDVVERQVLASIGMGHLMRSYDDLFGWHETIVAQALLTRRDLADRHGYLNARNTLLTLLELGVVPIVNENDVVATDEIDVGFGDNDSLSAQVANLVDADLLAILSDIAGLYTADPRTDPSAQLVKRVDAIDATVEGMAGGSRERGRGGMATKIQAAKLATASGSDVVVASGREPDVLTRLAFGGEIGTLFPAHTDHVESRRRWMISGLSVRGEVVIDDGAARALRHGGSSLLPAGIREVSGRFERGDSVAMVTNEGHRLALGIVNYDSADLKRVRGVKSDQIEGILGYQYGAEAVHRNNLVLL